MEKKSAKVLYIVVYIHDMKFVHILPDIDSQLSDSEDEMAFPMPDINSDIQSNKVSPAFVIICGIKF